MSPSFDVLILRKGIVTRRYVIYMERVIIMTRELYLKEMRYMRMLKPLIDAGKVRRLRTKGAVLEFIVDLTREAGVDKNFESYLDGPVPPGTKPSDLFDYFIMHSEQIPPLYLASIKDGKYYHIEKVTPSRFRDFIERIDEDHIIPYIGGKYASDIR